MESNQNHHHNTFPLQSLSPSHPPPPPPPPPPSATTASTKDKEAASLLSASNPFNNDRSTKVDIGDDEETEEELSDEENEEESMTNSTFIGRMVMSLQRAVRTIIVFINDKFGGHFFNVLFVLLYFAYFAYAMYYRFGDEPSIRLLWMTILGVLIKGRHIAFKLLSKTGCVQWCVAPKAPATAARIVTVRFFTKWLLYGAVGAFMGYVIVDVALKDPVKLRSLPGIFVFLLVCFLFSTHPSKVNWHTIYWSLGSQFILAVLVMRWQTGKDAVLWVQTRLDNFFENSKPASRLLFGDTYHDHYMVFGALPIVFLTNATLSMLYYVGAMQFMVKVIGTTLHYVLGTTAIESTGVAASIFMEGASAMLALRPYLNKLTNSELFALTTACLASIGGAFLAILAQLGIPVEFMLPAMVISAPATFAVCKLVVPETRRPQKMVFGGELPPDMQYKSILDAAQGGAISVISLVANVVVSVFAFFSLIAFTNTTFTWIGDRIGIQQLTMEKILSYVFYPFALLMGVELEDCRNAAMLMGYRLSSSNFISLLKMEEMVKNRKQLRKYSLIPNATVTYVGDHIVLDEWNMTLTDGIISRRTEAICTYSLCGFSGILSLFITLSIMATLVPRRRTWLASMAIPLLIAGNLANFMVGCFAGMLV